MNLSLQQGILFNDHYQLTMAQLYFRQGLHERTVLFDHYFRKYPDYGNHQAGYCVYAGMGWLHEWMKNARFGEQEATALRSLRNPDNSRVFDEDFIQWLLQNGHYEALSMRGVLEGRVVHPNTPLCVVRGPLAMTQMLETPLLAMLNYQTLIATRAARIRHSGRGQLMMDFGMRRGQDFGANAGTRAALIGGADFSSNVGVSHALGIPSKGTHAHSMVQVFMALGMTELEAFQAYADSYPDQCLLLVDTVNTLESGVPNAIRVFERLKKQGHRPMGIRLDSGDLAYLSIQCAKMLNEAGFDEVSIALSNNLDELSIWQIITQISVEARRYGVDPDALIRRMVFGVGTRLMTSEGAPALGGVFKLVAVDDQGHWQPAMKLSESSAKTPNPGEKVLWRLYDKRGSANADLVALDNETPDSSQSLRLRHAIENNKSRELKQSALSNVERLHTPLLEPGLSLCDEVDIEELRVRKANDIDRLDPGVMRLVNPHIYHVSLSQDLWTLKQDLIAKLKGRSV